MCLSIHREQLRFDWLARRIDHRNLLRGTGHLRLDLDYLGTRPGQRVKHDDWLAIPSRIDPGCNLPLRLVDDLVPSPTHVAQIAASIQIVHSYSRSRHDVVKMVEQQTLPRAIHFFLRISESVQQS